MQTTEKIGQTFSSNVSTSPPFLSQQILPVSILSASSIMIAKLSYLNMSPLSYTTQVNKPLSISPDLLTHSQILWQFPSDTCVSISNDSFFQGSDCRVLMVSDKVLLWPGVICTWMCIHIRPCVTIHKSKLCFIIISNECRHCGNKDESFINDREEITISRYPKTPND